MTAKYVYRMDDITPDMDWRKFWCFMKLFEENAVVPLLGVVPDNNDPKLSLGTADNRFWSIIKDLQHNGKAEIAQHGYRHELFNTGRIKCPAGIRGASTLTEIAGLPYYSQYEVISAGMQKMNSNGVYTDIWMAPCHTFDGTTLRILSELGFKYVSDGTSLYPRKMHGLTFVPQQLWRPRRLPFGVYTICLHTNNTDEEIYRSVKDHIEEKKGIISFSEAAAIKTGFWSVFVNFFFRIAYQLLRAMKQSSEGKRCLHEG